MGRPFGIPVYVAPTWFLVAALITWTYAPYVDGRLPGLGAASYLVAFAFAVLLYLSVLVHELSHSLVALRLGLPVRRIVLQLLGGVSEIEQEAPTPTREFLVAVAGPLVSLLLGAGGLIASRSLSEDTVVGLLVYALTVSNIIVGVFNLLPGLPLDGGRVLQAAVWGISGRRYTGILVAGWAGRILAGLLVAYAVFSLLGAGRGGGTFTLLWTLLLASFIWLGATESLRVAQLRERLPRVAARTLARRAIPVSADVPLAEALRRATEAGARALVVVDTNGTPVALVNEAAVAATPQERRPWVLVSTVSRRLEAGLVLPADLHGEELLRALGRTPGTEYLLQDSAGGVYGVLAAADVERAMAATT